MPKRALVLSGGGAKGAFQVGALEYLVNERGLDFDVIAGVSTGALSAIMLAQGAGLSGLRTQLTRLRELYEGIRSPRDIYRKRPLGLLQLLLFKSSLYDPEPLRRLLRRHVDLEALRSSGKALRVGAACLETGEYRTVDEHHPNVVDFACASGSMPVFFPPVRIDVNGERRSWVDGGVRHITPLSEAFRALKDLSDGQDGEDEMYVLLCSPLTTERATRTWKTGLPIAMRAVELLLNEIYRDDLAYACATNRSMRSLHQVRQRAVTPASQVALDDHLTTLTPMVPSNPRYVRLFIVMPREEYMDALEFDPKKIQVALVQGWAAAHAPLDQEQLEQLLGMIPATGAAGGMRATAAEGRQA